MYEQSDQFAVYGSFYDDLMMQIRYGGYPPIKVVWVFGQDPRKRSLNYAVELNRSNHDKLFYQGGDELWFSDPYHHATGYVSIQNEDDQCIIYYFSDAETALLFKLQFGV